MVVLNQIYTRTGDDGTTALGTGERRKKYDLRIDAYGTLDETNAAIGIARLHTAADAELDAMLARIQNDLFDLGADLCLAGQGQGAGRRAAAVTDGAGRGLEREIDALNDELAPLRSFVLPGGSAGGGLSASRPHHLPARRAADGRAGRQAGRERHRRSARNTSTGCPTSCSSPAVTPTTRARATCSGSRDRTAEQEPRGLLGAFHGPAATTRSPSSPARRAASAAPARSCSRAKAPAW